MNPCRIKHLSQTINKTFKTQVYRKQVSDKIYQGECYLDGKTRNWQKINCPLCSDNDLFPEETNIFMDMLNKIFIIYPQYLSHYFIES